MPCTVILMKSLLSYHELWKHGVWKMKEKELKVSHKEMLIHHQAQVSRSSVSISPTLLFSLFVLSHPPRLVCCVLCRLSSTHTERNMDSKVSAGSVGDSISGGGDHTASATPPTLQEVGEEAAIRSSK